MVGGGLLAGGDVDSAQRAGDGGDRLERPAHAQHLAVGHPALEAAGAVGGAGLGLLMRGACAAAATTPVTAEHARPSATAIPHRDMRNASSPQGRRACYARRDDHAKRIRWPADRIDGRRRT